jgi:hypothetical protein
MKVDVYYNLHKKVWSVREKATGLVDVTFKVSAAGNAKVRAEGRKNVHAWITGTLVSWYSGTITDTDSSEWIENLYDGRVLTRPSKNKAVYNPYKYTSFVVDGDSRLRLKKAAAVHMLNKQVYLARSL